MVKVSSLFSQLLKHFNRNEFAALVKKHGAERHAKGFSCWTQFVSMMFCQLAHADSLREICNGLKCCLGKVKHSGIPKAPNKSTLSYANEHRPAALYEDLFYSMYDNFRNKGGFGRRKKKFRFKNKLLSFDSSTISLCLALFEWAKFRRAKGGVKVHVLLDHDQYMPSFVYITGAGKHDVTVARMLKLNPGSIVAMDRAYNDYEMFGQWTARGVFFVTRQKDNAVYEVVETRRVPLNRNILSDEIIRLTGVDALRIQIWTALIAILLLKWMHHLSKANWSFSNLASMLRLSLFTYRDLVEWLHHPFSTDPIVPLPEQLPLALPHFGQARR